MCLICRIILYKYVIYISEAEVVKHISSLRTQYTKAKRLLEDQRSGSGASDTKLSKRLISPSTIDIPDAILSVPKKQIVEVKERAFDFNRNSINILIINECILNKF